MFDERFNAVEVVEMAKNIEQRGLRFYQAQAKQTDDEKLRDLFLKLAADEEDHYNRFKNLGKQIKEETKKEAEYAYDPEVSAYLEAIVEFTIFPAEETVNIKTIEDALQIAIFAEKDSILFYQEMLQYNEGETAEMLKKLIEEEKSHLLELVRYDAQLA